MCKRLSASLQIGVIYTPAGDDDQSPGGLNGFQMGGPRPLPNLPGLTSNPLPEKITIRTRGVGEVSFLTGLEI
ncbi:MAG TPA: hypothetical protein DIU35_06100 [Candidatus Latescibacteria bacterium]|nr:hypothetical protein [Candidatus Latescibacterota bacterium]